MGKISLLITTIQLIDDYFDLKEECLNKKKLDNLADKFKKERKLDEVQRQQDKKSAI